MTRVAAVIFLDIRYTHVVVRVVRVRHVHVEVEVVF